jgi:hypothetical protein
LIGITPLPALFDDHDAATNQGSNLVEEGIAAAA